MFRRKNSKQEWFSAYVINIKTLFNDQIIQKKNSQRNSKIWKSVYT
jgi:ribosomal protein S11